MHLLIENFSEVQVNVKNSYYLRYCMKMHELNHIGINVIPFVFHFKMEKVIWHQDYYDVVLKTIEIV